MGRKYEYAKNREYQQAYQKARYERLITEGRCVMCGDPMNGDTHRYCQKCRVYYNRQQKERYHARREAAAHG